MTSQSNQSAGRRPLAAVLWLAPTGLALSLFLLWFSLRGERVPGCGAEGGCDEVLHSRWSSWFGLPVSLPAALMYGAVLWGAIAYRRETNPESRRKTGNLLTMAAVALAGAAIWFIGLQLLVIHAICKFCMATHLVSLATASTLWLGLAASPSAPMADKDPKPGKRKQREIAAKPAGPPGRVVQVMGGIAAVAVLVIGQLAWQPKTYQIQAMSSPPPAAATTPANPAVVAVPAKPVEAPPLAVWKAPPEPETTGKSLQLPNGLAVDLTDVPLMGPPNAPHFALHLFDYSCSHCRALHPVLRGALQQLSNQVTVVSLPVPLCTNCNRLVRTQYADHLLACEYARIGLAVWRAAPSRLHEFDDWIFAPPRPPSPAEARAEAIRLVGEGDFNKAIADPWVEQKINLGVNLYEANMKRYRVGQLPQMMVANNLVYGTVLQVGNLYRIMADNFGITNPPPPAASP
ncbi:MAG TPA: vitamin K epoxide reductase family protein [Verrucomicrobiae bacterium]|nr:vitamin K epoxide reductase family protein [Verrucomicrobiae bacterium]